MLPIKFKQEQLVEISKNFIINNKVKDIYDKQLSEPIKLVEASLLIINEFNELLIKSSLKFETEEMVRNLVDFFPQSYLQEINYLLIEYKNSIYNKHAIEAKIRLLVSKFNQDIILLIKFYISLEKISEENQGGFF